MFSYLGDITTTGQRTVRMSVLNLFMYAGQPLGNLAGGAIYDNFGYNTSFYFFIAISVIGAVYSVWRLDSGTHLRSGPAGLEGSGFSDHSYKEKVKELFSVWKNGKETLGTFTKRRDGNKRAVLVLMGASLLVGLFPIYGK